LGDLRRDPRAQEPGLSATHRGGSVGASRRLPYFVIEPYDAVRRSHIAPLAAGNRRCQTLSSGSDTIVQGQLAPFLTHPRATHSTVILGLVPRTQPSAREKRWDGSNTGSVRNLVPRAAHDASIGEIGSVLDDGSSGPSEPSGQARGQASPRMTSLVGCCLFRTTILGGGDKSSRFIMYVGGG
jgi:hypothetical protein